MKRGSTVNNVDELIPYAYRSCSLDNLGKEKCWTSSTPKHVQNTPVNVLRKLPLSTLFNWLSRDNFCAMAPYRLLHVVKLEPI